MRVMILCAICVSHLGLAACTTTKESRAQAGALSRSVDDYMKSRRSSIDELNANYRATYATLLSQYRSLSQDRLKLERDADARSMADAILLDWATQTTFAAISRELKSARARQLDGINNRAAAIAEARRIYAEAYNALDLELNKLEDAKRKLADLSQEEDARQATFAFISMLAKAYESTQKQNGDGE